MKDQDSIKAGEGYTEQELIHALAVCMAGVLVSLEQLDHRSVEDGFRMAKGMIEMAEEQFGPNWTRDKLFEVGLRTASKRLQEAMGIDDVTLFEVDFKDLRG